MEYSDSWAKQTQSSTWTPEQLWGIDVGACDRRMRRWTL